VEDKVTAYNNGNANPLGNEPTAERLDAAGARQRETQSGR
jgi:hypothetical protein